MRNNSTSDPYSYDGTNVLKNKLNITDERELLDYERAIVSKKLLSLHIRPNNGDFSYKHYIGLHKYLFGDIYPFAGKTRCVDIMKGETYFAHFRYIDSSLNDILNEMKNELPKSNDKEEYALKLAKYYLDINFVHPFREGNGRCQREFFREYVLHLNKVLPFEELELDYSKMNKGLMLVSVITNNEELMKQEFLKALIPLEKEKVK